jgi:hypothetical protein
MGMSKVDTRTLDERIRAWARKEYVEEVETLFAPIHRAMKCDSLKLAIEHPEGYEYGSNGKRYLAGVQAIKALQDALILKYAGERESQAITEFMEKVDKLDAEVEELRNFAREG